ncbi:hypothetical protein ASD81_20270 [Nocardioides sp. Root614]|nr:hypothetical protein ASD81_20270 [Nocardioides sp. Root614]KRA86947.1 hypothetical protein ASD84_22485 [Nocardioides sp. Root682]
MLLHGANGTGKTSILAALEMGLTGQIRSMRRHDPRYTAYLPHIGQDFATIRVDLDEKYAANKDAGPLTVGGSRVEGAAALSETASAFFSERCYLDQVSLGQLLELYQYSEGKEESALARFVNELLGLEQLDALRSGLDHAGHWGRLKNLSDLLEAATKAADRSADVLATQTTALQQTQTELTQAKLDLRAALSELGVEAPTNDDQELLEIAAAALRTQHLETDKSSASSVFQELLALGGRIAAVSDRKSTVRLDAARGGLEVAEVAYQAWQRDNEPAIRAVHLEAAALELRTEDGLLDSAEFELQAAQRTLVRQSKLVEELLQAQRQHSASKAQLEELSVVLASEHEQAGRLVEGLAAIRASMPDDADKCPVCERDYGQVSTLHLSTRIDQRLAELTTQGERLMSLRADRDASVTAEAHASTRLRQLTAEVLSDEQRQQLAERRKSLTLFRQRLVDIQPLVQEGRDLRRVYEEARDLAQQLEEAAKEVTYISDELDRLARILGVTNDPAESIHRRSQMLSSVAASRLAEIETRERRVNAVGSAQATLIECRSRLAQSTQTVADAAQKRKHWDDRVAEARRRQSVAKAVHTAAATARSEVVRHVFTDSLNQVWRSVFARLAPREQYIPTFGDPNTTRTALELKLQTIHISGEVGGSPQMMLSAGNLNTAALSLFLALHLAVEPTLPCLVFDDPVQAMDEVHVSQFAGLIRMLSKHHNRQVVIAVHERELFEYLSLELSPAYEGDELITIELGGRGENQEERVTRHPWRPDLAIAT